MNSGRQLTENSMALQKCADDLLKSESPFAFFIQQMPEIEKIKLSHHAAKFMQGRTGRILNDLKDGDDFYAPSSLIAIFIPVPDYIREAVKNATIKNPQDLLSTLNESSQVMQWIKYTKAYVTYSLFDKSGNIRPAIRNALNIDQLLENNDLPTRAALLQKIKNELWFSFFAICSYGIYDEAAKKELVSKEKTEEIDLNPFKSVGYAINEILKAHQEIDADNAMVKKVYSDFEKNEDKASNYFFDAAYKQFLEKLKFMHAGADEHNEVIKFGCQLLESTRQEFFAYVDEMDQLELLDILRESYHLLEQWPKVDAHSIAIYITYINSLSLKSAECGLQYVGAVHRHLAAKEVKEIAKPALVEVAASEFEEVDLFREEKIKKCKDTFECIIRGFYFGEIKPVTIFSENQFIQKNKSTSIFLDGIDLNDAFNELNADYYLKLLDGKFELKRRSVTKKDVYMIDLKVADVVGHLSPMFTKDEILQMKMSDLLTFKAINSYAAMVANCIELPEHEKNKLVTELDQLSAKYFKERKAIPGPSFFERHPYLKYSLAGVAVCGALTAIAMISLVSFGVLTVPAILAVPAALGSVMGGSVAIGLGSLALFSAIGSGIGKIKRTILKNKYVVEVKSKQAAESQPMVVTQPVANSEAASHSGSWNFICKMLCIKPERNSVVQPVPEYVVDLVEPPREDTVTPDRTASPEWGHRSQKQ